VSDLEQNIDGNLLVETRNGQGLGIVEDGDVWQCFYGATGAGFGDPIKREPAFAKKDLDNELLTIDRCRSVHCIEAGYDKKAEEWVVDEKKTAELREKKKQERLAKGVATEQWWQKRRQDLIDGKMPSLMKKMYNESLAKGEHWPGEFRDFWCLPDGFTFEED
jgi:hypothetical protein